MARVTMGRRWRRPPAALRLGRDGVHVWQIPLDVSQNIVGELVSLLSDEENARARQMLDGEATRRFVAAHGALRGILSRYLGERPEQVRIVQDARGKPHLASRADVPPVCFNLSHSGELALCAVVRGREVGVDVEQIRPVPAWREIAVRYFSQAEYEALCSLGQDLALPAFLRSWTCKEAYSKALGQGVSQRWPQFRVSPGLDGGTELPTAGVEGEGEGRFTLCPLEPGPGYVAALAVEGGGWHLCCWRWSWEWPAAGS